MPKTSKEILLNPNAVFNKKGGGYVQLIDCSPNFIINAMNRAYKKEMQEKDKIIEKLEKGWNVQVEAIKKYEAQMQEKVKDLEDRNVANIQGYTKLIQEKEKEIQSIKKGFEKMKYLYQKSSSREIQLQKIFQSLLEELRKKIFKTCYERKNLNVAVNYIPDTDVVKFSDIERLLE